MTETNTSLPRTCSSSSPPETITFPPEGAHLIADAWGVCKERLNDMCYLKDLLASAVATCGATLVKIDAAHFEPNGVTVVAILAESHATLHTYPDHGIMMIDAFTCGPVDPEPLIRTVIEGVQPTSHIVRRASRGNRAPYFVEEPLSSGQSRVWALQEVFAHERTPFQEVLIGRTEHGMTLFCNHERQSAELTQLIYHEGQFIPAALLAAKRSSVLIIGSSEGVVTQLARWCGAERVVHVDIDRQCVELCAQHLPYGYTPSDIDVYRSGRHGVELLYEDGFSVIERFATGEDRFDIIVIDLPDEEPDGNAQHNRLYDRAFLGQLRGLLRPGGAVIAQGGCASYWRNKTLARSLRRFQSIFASAVYFELTEQDWVWIVGTESPIADPVGKMRETLATLPYRPNFIDDATIGAATVIPMGLRRILAAGANGDPV